MYVVCIIDMKIFTRKEQLNFPTSIRHWIIFIGINKIPLESIILRNLRFITMKTLLNKIIQTDITKKINVECKYEK